MQIHIADTNELTELDKQMLSVLVGGATPAPTKTAAPSAGKPATPAPEPEVEAEQTPMQQAVAIATGLVGEGKQAELKAKLTELGVKRTSELKGDALNQFIAELG